MDLMRFILPTVLLLHVLARASPSAAQQATTQVALLCSGEMYSFDKTPFSGAWRQADVDDLVMGTLDLEKSGFRGVYGYPWLPFTKVTDTGYWHTSQQTGSAWGVYNLEVGMDRRSGQLYAWVSRLGATTKHMLLLVHCRPDDRPRRF